MAKESLARAKHCPPAPRAKKHKSRLLGDGQEHRTKPDEHIRKFAEEVSLKEASLCISEVDAVLDVAHKKRNNFVFSLLSKTRA